MRMRTTTIVIAAVLAIAGASLAFNVWQQRPIVRLVAEPEGVDYGGGIVTRQVDETALREAKTVEDFKRITGLRIDTAPPTPSPWRG